MRSAEILYATFTWKSGFASPDAQTLLQKQIQAFYETHRTRRNAQKKDELLHPSYQGVSLDPVLMKSMIHPDAGGEPDWRHCLVFWARPPQHVRDVINEVQQRLLAVLPNLWLMPLDCLHMTVLEVDHSRSADEIAKLLDLVRPKMPEITDYTYSHRSRLVKPMVSYDGAALAISFVPAAGEGFKDAVGDDDYTYHHLRRDMYGLISSTGVTVASRYVMPSSHLTIARFVAAEDFHTLSEEGKEGPYDPEKMRDWIETIEGINRWLQAEYWNEQEGSPSGKLLQWRVGEEKGLDCRYGTVWYGGGQTFQLGKGFERFCIATMGDWRVYKVVEILAVWGKKLVMDPPAPVPAPVPAPLWTLERPITPPPSRREAAAYKERVQIQTLRETAGWTHERIGLHMGMPTSTVAYIATHPATPRKARGRPCIIDTPKRHRMVDFLSSSAETR
ncbi:MAG: snoRNA-binding rRNA-processing protein [Watsoniomyces obsoletus]|nr:MAG: snoRNA-binding rRNA-processing protein [Watsoniomyces obsoletus]